MTPVEEVFEAGRFAGHQAGWKEGFEAGRESALHPKSRPLARLHRPVQVVEVDGYAYRWEGEPLEVGDRVLLPENWLSRIKDGPGPFPGTVTRIGSDYRGELSTILRRLEEAAS